MLHCTALGSARLRLGDKVLDRKEAQLVALLTIHAGRRASALDIRRTLWPEARDARNSLARARSTLKSWAGCEVVAADRDHIWLAVPVTTDLDELQALIESGRAERVADLGADAVLADVSSPIPEVSAVLESRRSWFDALHANALTFLAERAIAEGRLTDAASRAEQLTTQHPSNVQGWLLRLTVHRAMGNPQLVRTTADAVRTLERKGILQIDPRTRAALTDEYLEIDWREDAAIGDLVRRGSGYSLHPHAHHQLMDAWNQVARSHGGAIHVRGGVGLGKTTLLRSIATAIGARGGSCLWIRGHPSTRDIPHDAIGRVVAQLAQLPGASGISEESTRWLREVHPAAIPWAVHQPSALPGEVPEARYIDALRDMVAAVSEEGAVALLLDDIDWVDDASRRLLALLSVDIGDTAVLIISTGHGRSLAASTEIGLTPVGTEEVLGLLQSVARTPTDDWVRELVGHIVRAGHGEPLLILTLLELLQDGGHLTIVNGEWSTPNAHALLGAAAVVDPMRSRLEALASDDLDLLLCIAVADGSIGGMFLAQAVGLSYGSVADRCRWLETRGFLAIRQPDVFSIHAVVAEGVRLVASADAVERIRVRVGRALLAGAADQATLAAGMRLLEGDEHAGDRAEGFQRYAQHRYQTGDRRWPRTMARDVLGRDAAPVRVRELVRALPLTMRVGLLSVARRRVVAAGIVVCGAVSAAAALSVTPPEPDAELVVAWQESSGRLAFTHAELRMGAWEVGKPVQMKPWSNAALSQSVPGQALGVSFDSRVGRLAVTSRNPDDGFVDAYLVEKGVVSRLTDGHGEHGGATFSPSGTAIAYATSRWDTLARYDVAIVSVSDRITMRLTEGPASDGVLAWSPDGTLLAVERSMWGMSPNALCIIAVESRREQCIEEPPGEWLAPVPIGWRDNDVIVAVRQEGLVRSIAQLDIESRGWTTLFQGAVNNAQLSSDGNWIYCECSTVPGGSLTPAVFPVDAPHLIRTLVSPSIGARVGTFWLASPRGPMQTVLLRAPESIPPGVPIQLRAESQFDAGWRGVSGVRWRLADTSQGTVDERTGILVASSRATKVVVGAWRRDVRLDTVTIQVDHRPATGVLSEDWREARLDRWYEFGLPRPTVELEGRRHVLLLNGDGFYESGLISRDAIAVGNGVAVDAEIALPLTSPQGQLLRLGIREAAPFDWAQRAGIDATLFQRAGTVLCAVSLPFSGRHFGMRAVATLEVNGREYRARIPTDVLSGSWHALRLQYLPDGSCGIALDGIAVATAWGPAPALPSVQVFMDGSSRNTKLRVGRVDVARGVPGGVDWRAATHFR